MIVAPHKSLQVRTMLLLHVSVWQAVCPLMVVREVKMFRSDSSYDALRSSERRNETSTPASEVASGSAFATRTLDITGALAFFVLFGWLMAVIAVLVGVTTGRPVIYRHTRIGRDGQKFGCLKFRSMVHNSDAILATYLATHPEAKAEWDRDFKLKDDPRVTKFGRFIRKTSMDELPQFWNVLKGEMSLVGPRPVTEKEILSYYGPASILCLQVKPGITGLWQVSGRSTICYSDRIKIDCEYVKTRTLAKDIKIILLTIKAVLTGHGSH